jgi:hypothetical protein
MRSFRRRLPDGLDCPPYNRPMRRGSLEERQRVADSGRSAAADVLLRWDRTLARNGAVPLVLGRLETPKFRLQTTSVLSRSGHRLRAVTAAVDNGAFVRGRRTPE